MWIDPNSIAYFEEQANRHGAFVLEDLPLPDGRFLTASGIPRTNLMVARSSVGGFALFLPEDLTPRTADLAPYFRMQETQRGWRLLTLPQCDTVESALLRAGQVLGLEREDAGIEAPVPAALPAPTPDNTVRIPSGRSEHSTDDRQGETPAFTTDLTAAARLGKIAPVHGRERELDGVITVLLQHSKNCPLLVGEAGVGKTAVAEKLAIRSAEDALPKPLQGLRVLSLNVPALIAASGQKGGLEKQTGILLDQLEKNPTWMLFVDEIHSLADARGDIAMFDAIKPRLTSGLRLMGATTHSEYQEKMAPDPALARRFTLVTVDEPGAEDTQAILLSRLPSLVTHHQVRVTVEQVASIVRLADEYFPSKRRPDKTLTLLDRAMAAEALKGYRNEA